jgi:PAS domain S-box-containing protein
MWAGILTAFVITIVALVVGQKPVLAVILAIPPIVTIPRGDQRGTTVVALLSLVLVVVLSVFFYPDAEWNTYLVRIFVVAAAGAVAIWAVTVRAGTQTGLAALADENALLHEDSERERSLLDALLENAPTGVAVVNDELTFVRVNRVFAVLAGSSVEQMLGRSLTDAIPTVTAVTVDGVNRALRTGESLIDQEITVPREGRREDRDDVFLHYRASYFPIAGPDGPLGVGIVAQDVTEQEEVRREVERQRLLYETLLRAQSEGGLGMALLDGESIVYVNDAATEILGYAGDEFRSLDTYLDIIPAAEQQRMVSWLAGVVLDETADPQIETRVRHRDGRVVDLELTAQVVTGASPVVSNDASIVIVGRDVTDRKTAERERAELLAAEQSARVRLEDSHRRMSVLARAGAILERSLDLRETLPLVAGLVVTEIADSCVIDVRTNGRGERRMASAERPGSPVAPDESRLLVLPLLAGDAVLGSMSVGRRTLDDHEDQLVRELARRVALAVTNAQLYRERDQVAATLQRSLLPPDLPELPGFELAAAFRAAGRANEVGGDFYDAFLLGGDRWALVIGDVCGKGADAAAITALARYAIRTIATDEDGPGTVLGRVNEVLLRHGDPERFVTALFARVDVSDPSRVVVASAGHPPPVVLRAGGEPAVEKAVGTLLGVVEEPRLPDHELRLDVGDTLVLVTDGVLEARIDRDSTDILGLPGMLRELAALADRSPAGIAEGLADVAQVSPERQRDDIAILVLRRTR